MSEQGLTIAQAARALGVSTRTVRRFIKSGKIQAVLTPGPFGEEYRIHELPAVPRDRPADTPLDKTSPQATVQTMDIIRELQDRNLALAAQLGAATERIRQLEGQLKVLSAPRRRPWWQRLFRLGG